MWHQDSNKQEASRSEGLCIPARQRKQSSQVIFLKIFLLCNRPFSKISKVSVRPMCLSAGLCVTNRLRSHNTSRISCQRSLPAARSNSQQQPANLFQGSYATNTKLTFAFMSLHVPLNIPSLCFFKHKSTHTRKEMSMELWCTTKHRTNIA